MVFLVKLSATADNSMPEDTNRKHFAFRYMATPGALNGIARGVPANPKQRSADNPPRANESVYCETAGGPRDHPPHTGCSGGIGRDFRTELSPEDKTRQTKGFWAMDKRSTKPEA